MIHVGEIIFLRKIVFCPFLLFSLGGFEQLCYYSIYRGNFQLAILLKACKVWGYNNEYFSTKLTNMKTLISSISMLNNKVKM